MTPFSGMALMCRSVPLDKGYTHTIFFSTKEAQFSYFFSKRFSELNSQSFIRPESGEAIFEGAYKYLSQCNYLVFKNTAYSDKYYYAFVDSVEYVNDHSCRVLFTIDVLQTFHFDYSLDMCFVEREHSYTDEIGGNLVPENLDVGEYVSMGLLYQEIVLPELCIVVATSFDESGSWAPGNVYNGVYNGVHQFAYSLDQIDSLNALIKDIVDKGKGEGILSIYMMPKDFFSNTGFPKQLRTSKNYSGLTGGYAPKNKKLYTYPYNFISATNGTGVSAEYRYENFSSNDCVFEYFGDASLNPSMILYPVGYNGYAKYYDGGITVSGFPQCAFTTDSFRAWLAQNASSVGLQTLSAAGTLATGVATANPLMVAGGAMAAANLVGTFLQQSVVPPQARGNSGNGTLDVALDRKGFLLTKLSLKPERLKIIDDYFTMFGYATRRVKTPNRSARPQYTYTKTLDCTISGAVPGDYEKKICDIYNKGITFWRDGNNVGNYNVNNSV